MSPITTISTANILFSPAAVDSPGTGQCTIPANATPTCSLVTRLGEILCLMLDLLTVPGDSGGGAA